jgi:pyrroloquinoline quinone (PQQ) biosynthesis protein C
MAINIRLGEKMSPEAAKRVVDELYQEVAQRWEEKVNRTPFMMRLKEGKLPREVLRTFFRNWGAFTIEINTIAACSYHKFLPFFKKHRDLLAPIGEKIADEFIHPKPPGHVLVMLQTAEALGLTEEEIFTQPMLSEFRAKIDFIRSLLYEGTTAEWYSAVTTEEQIGHWSAACYKAFTEHYGFTREQATYFATHVEADLEEHEEGVMGHGTFNRLALQRLLEAGMADERPTYGVEYCAMTSVDLHGVMLRSALDEAERSEQD